MWLSDRVPLGSIPGTRKQIKSKNMIWKGEKVKSQFVNKRPEQIDLHQVVKVNPSLVLDRMWREGCFTSNHV